MSDWELLSSYNGLNKYIRGLDDGSVDVRYEGFDVAPILDANKALQNEDFDRRADMWHVASIPVSVMYEWLVKHGVNAWNPRHSKDVKRLLNSSDYRYLKTKDVVI
jgi:hypothetical protein